MHTFNGQAVIRLCIKRYLVMVNGHIFSILDNSKDN
jgi:hypothetical protein